MRPSADVVEETPSRPLAISMGAGLGLLSGLTGTGGGIFLTPLLLFTHWARAKNAAVSALFILMNLISGLLGNLSCIGKFPVFAIILAGAAIIGGSMGSYFGSRKFNPTLIKQLLAAVLLVAGFKLILT